MRGMPTPNNEDPATRMWVLVLDSPQVFTARQVNDTRTGESWVVRLPESSGHPQGWPPYQDQRVQISAWSAETAFPSDTSLPLGQLRLGSVLQVVPAGN